MAGAELALRNLDEIVRERYQRSAERITREFRIFTGTNAAVCALLACMALLRPRAGLHLMPLVILLLATSAAAAGFYLFGQDWLTTIVFGSYLGWAYAIFLGIAFLFLADVALNRGRVTTTVLRVFADLTGNTTLIILPC